MANLRLVPASGDPIEVTKDQIMVGRDPTCEVVLNDGSVSRKHARIERRGGGWAVVDQASANGTFLDSQRIADSVLKNGQELRFGAAGYKIEIPGEESDDLSATIASAPAATTIQPVVAPPAPPPPKAAPPPPPPPPAPRVAAPPPPPPRAAAPPPPPPPPPPPRFGPRPGSPGSPVASEAPPPAPGKKGKGPLFWILTGCCGCISLVVIGFAAFFGYFYYTTKVPVDATRVMIEDIKKNDLDKAYSRLSSSYQARMSRDDFAAFVAAHPALQDNRDSTFASRNVKNDVATLEDGILIASSGITEIATFELMKEGGEWKVSDIRFRESISSGLAPPGMLRKASGARARDASCHVA